MTERDLFISCIPGIAQVAAEWGKLDKQEYEERKREMLQSLPETVRGFMDKVFIVIDSLVSEVQGTSGTMKCNECPVQDAQ